jgi:hypothetical protein
MNDEAPARWLDEVENLTKAVTSVELGRHAGDQRASGPGASEDEPAVKLVDALLRQAVREGASAVHVEPSGTETLVRFRVDGTLHEVLEVTGPRSDRWLSASVGRHRYVDTGAATAAARANAEASDLGHESESAVAHALVEAAHEGRNGSR